MRYHPLPAIAAGVLVGAGVGLLLIAYAILPFGLATLALPQVLFPALALLIAYAGPVRHRRLVHRNARVTEPSSEEPGRHGPGSRP
jgi:hypothetical protein